jgi:hypothetical protein
MRENWRAVVGYEGHYVVSDSGRVRSLKRRQFDGSPNYLRWGNDVDGYASVDLWRDSKPTRKRIHILVARAFLGPCPLGHEVRHLDGNRKNPRLSNLAYGTRGDNVRDKRVHGTDHNVAKTHCPSGHPYDEVNTYVLPSRPTARYCRACSRASALRRYHAKRAA